MMATNIQKDCIQTELVHAYALHALSPEEAQRMQVHLAECARCRQELKSLRAVTHSFVAWPTAVLRPSASLWQRLESRIGAEDSKSTPLPATSAEPQWREVAPGISCKLLASDHERDRVSMLVRLEPGVAYPPHEHVGVEELHLLEGELWIDDRKLLAGDFNRAEPGSTDTRVWSETGCTCVLMTSPTDVLR